MQSLIEMGILAGVSLLALLIIGFIFARLYKRASKETAFVRTGLGGQKVIMDGGAIVLPVFHEIIPVNMNTLKLEVQRRENESLITRDRMRVDVVAGFFVRVKQTAEAVSTAAQTLGQRTLDPDALKGLVEDKFVDSLRATAATMSMQELQDKRRDFVQAVQNAVAEDLEKNGLELESVSLTSLDQTDKKFFNPDNAFDAEGLTQLTHRARHRGAGAHQEPRSHTAEARHRQTARVCNAVATARNRHHQGRADRADRTTGSRAPQGGGRNPHRGRTHRQPEAHRGRAAGQGKRDRQEPRGANAPDRKRSPDPGQAS
jgi:uncharacterized membrane protein YqiK